MGKLKWVEIHGKIHQNSLGRLKLIGEFWIQINENWCEIYRDINKNLNICSIAGDLFGEIRISFHFRGIYWGNLGYINHQYCKRQRVWGMCKTKWRMIVRFFSVGSPFQAIPATLMFPCKIHFATYFMIQYAVITMSTVKSLIFNPFIISLNQQSPFSHDFSIVHPAFSHGETHGSHPSPALAPSCTPRDPAAPPAECRESARQRRARRATPRTAQRRCPDADGMMGLRWLKMVWYGKKCGLIWFNMDWYGLIWINMD